MKTLTTKYMIKEINKCLSDMGMNVEVKEIYSTKYSKDQYESGACRQIVTLKDRDGETILRKIFCFLTRKELADDINKGGFLKVKNIRGQFELELTA